MFDFYNSKSYTFRGDFMVTVNNFSKMLAMDEDEVREHISHMKEKDAKELLIRLINFINQQNREGSKFIM